MPKRTRSYDAWLLKELTDPVIAANYINAASEDSDEMLLVAMRNVAEAHKMSHVAQEANVNRESLYKTLSSEGNPRLGNLRSILDVFGLRILVAPKHAISDGVESAASGAQINYRTRNILDTAATSSGTVLNLLATRGPIPTITPGITNADENFTSTESRGWVRGLATPSASGLTPLVGPPPKPSIGPGSMPLGLALIAQAQEQRPGV